MTGEMEQVHIASNVRSEVFVAGQRSSSLTVVRAGHTAAFIWPFTIARYPNPQFTTRFTDDAGLHWQIDNDLHLKKLDNRDW
jgi:hypothetical protein